MRTKKDLLYELKTVQQVIKNSKRTEIEINHVVGEVLIDIRDILKDICDYLKGDL